MIMKPYNTRIAPSPTGNMHLGTARTAYFNFLVARASGGKFILRIDDTDKDRCTVEYLNDIKQTMQWLGLNYDEEVIQSERLHRHVSMAKAIIGLNIARELDDGAIVLNLPEDMPKAWTDEIAGEIKITDRDLELIDGLVLVRSNGMPTYNWASVLDDHDCEIDYIIRGHDHISNTAKHIAIFTACGMPIPKFAHVGLIHHQKKKLSKRDDAASMLYYRDQGYDPDAVLNFILRLGWGPKNENKSHKLIDRSRAIDLFLKDGNMRSAPSNMDLNQLESYDRKYKAQKNIWRNKDRLVTENEV